MEYKWNQIFDITLRSMFVYICWMKMLLALLFAYRRLHYVVVIHLPGNIVQKVIIVEFQ